jgi:diacylglycerol kinase family enzyme
MTPALVLINPAAGGGRAKTRWSRMRPLMARRYRATELWLDPNDDWISGVQQALSEGIRLFVAAGGDGTVNLLLNALLRTRAGVPLGDLVLGAIGLGSSNDFHKPMGNTEAGIPVKLDLVGSKFRDVCRARYRDPLGAGHERYFLVSASLGVTAEANQLFSSGGALQRALRRRCFPLAMLNAALRGIVGYRSHKTQLVWREGAQSIARQTELVNLSLLKTPHLSGGLRFDTATAFDDGLLTVTLCENMNRAQTLKVLFDLGQGRFCGRPGRSCWQTPRLSLSSSAAVPVEMDGEVICTNEIEFDILSERIRVCL